MTDGPTNEQSQISELLQAWQAIGESLFADGDTIMVPKLALMRATVELFTIEVALTKRKGNLTHAANDLGTSRRVIRDKLKAVKRYPWSPIALLEFSVP